MSIPKMLQSFKYAFSGFFELLRTENNMKFHALASVFTIGLGKYLGLSPRQWCIIVICIGMVMSAEAFNTALEKLCDKLHPEKDEAIRQVKDFASAAVLILALVSLTVACLIFLPKLIELFPIKKDI
ncbi:MAG: diacylglycerol kinase family protein [Leadbetterella sp.]